MIKRINQGFTLVELLVAITLLSMIMLLGTWSFSVFTNKWEGRLGYFSQHVSQSKDHILLSDVISAISPHLINVGGKGQYYFVSSSQEIKAVSQSAIFHANTPVTFKLSVEQFEDGSKYLLYQESVLTPFNVDTPPEYSHEKILIENARELSFSVLAWSNAHEKVVSEDPLSGGNQIKPVWRDGYNSLQTNIMPLAVRIYWDQGVIEVPLINDQGFWITLINQSGIENE